MRCCPGSSSGPINCCCGWRIRSYATNGLAVPTRDAAPPAAMAGWSRHPEAVVVVLVICPSRLRKDNQVFIDCIQLLTNHQPGNELHIVREVSVPGGSVDHVIVSARRGQAVDFVGVELQTLDTTGDWWPLRQKALRNLGVQVDADPEDERKPQGINWKMTAKTILVQIHHKITARQQFLPSLSVRGGQAGATWIPVFIGEDAHRLVELSGLMPTSARGANRWASASSTRLAATILSRMLGISGNGHLFYGAECSAWFPGRTPGHSRFSGPLAVAVSPVGAPGGCAVAVGVAPEKYRSMIVKSSLMSMRPSK